MTRFVKKRDGRKVQFKQEKILNVFKKVLNSTHPDDTLNNDEEKLAESLTLDAVNLIFVIKDELTVEQIQDIVQKVLINNGLVQEAKNFISYRNERTAKREYNNALTKTYRQMLSSKAQDMDLMRENANIDGNSVMGTMLRVGTEATKNFAHEYVLKPEYSYAHRNGDMHIHDLDFSLLTFNCCQIPVGKLLKNGFSTGHGFLRQPQTIQSAASLCCIAIQSNQNDMFGGQGIATFEYDLAPYVAKSYAKNLKKIVQIITCKDIELNEISDLCDSKYNENGSVFTKESQKDIGSYISFFTKDKTDYALDKAKSMTENDTYQAMEALVHNLNTMQSRAGAQTPFSSINYGTGTTEECRMIIKSVLKATDEGLGQGETAIFPVQIFRLHKGVNMEKGDPNYDLFELACKVSAKRLFPNFEYLDVPFNLQYYKEGHPETEIAVMGCRTRVIGNSVYPQNEVYTGRGNFSFTTINLPRLGIEAKGDWDKFYKDFDKMIDLAKNQLLDRFEMISHKHVYNYPFLMQQGVWIDSDNLDLNDEIGDVIKNASISIGFIGLAECLKAMMGKHHGESDEAYQKGLEIIRHLREKTDSFTKQYNLNFSTFASPAEGLSGRFTRLDKKRYGIIEGVTDREYYTNSFHIPVYFKIQAYKKMQLEGKFHELCNAGAITYIEADGDLTKNVQAFEDIVKYAGECGISYFSINHAVDRCPVCGYTGIIGDECPKCGFREGVGVSLEQLKKRGLDKLCCFS